MHTTRSTISAQLPLLRCRPVAGPLPALRRAQAPRAPLAACAALSTSAAAAANPALAATTTVVDLRSPPDVIARKRAELDAMRPGGPGAALILAALAPFVWAAGFVGPLGQMLSGAEPAAAGPPAAPAQLAPPPFPVHEEWVAVNGMKLHCVSPGGRRPGKPLMLFVHGFPELWYSWRYQMQEFADDYDVVAVDQRGYNDSDKPDGIASFRLQLLASDIKGLVKALGHEKCTLVAHDWGGNVAWVVAGMYGPELVERLIVMGLPHTGVFNCNMDLAQAAKSSYMLQFQAPALPEASLVAGGAASMETFFLRQPAGVVNPGAMTRDDVDWYRAAMLKPGAARSMIHYYRAFLRTFTLADQPGDDDVWRALRAPLVIPALVLHGDRDVALGVKLLDGIEAAFDTQRGGEVEVKLLKDCSHWVQQDYPLQVNAIMRDWLARQDQKKAS